jgi:hypothetical protein
MAEVQKTLEALVELLDKTQKGSVSFSLILCF